MQRFALSLFVVVALIVNALHAQHRTSEAIATHVRPYLDAERVNGLSIGIISRKDQATLHFGKKSKNGQHANSPNDQTVYEIGSITKVFTGILLGHAVNEGRVRLDQPIGSIAEYILGKETRSIQLVQLATHTSGLPRMPGNWQPFDQRKPYQDYDREMLMQFLSSFKPDRTRDPRMEYSNLGFGLLGELLSLQADQDYETLVREKITRPLGMTDTTITLSADQKKRFAPPHNADMVDEFPWEFDVLAGAGAIRSTTSDMLRFARAAMNPPADQLGRAIELSWKQHLPSREGRFAMGLGWHIARDGTTRWHNGQTGGYHSALYINRESRIAVIVLCNTATGDVDRIAESVLQIVAGATVAPPKIQKHVSVQAAYLQRLTGRYQVAPNFVVEVRIDDGNLVVQAPCQESARVYPMSNNRWKYRLVDAEIVFSVPEGAKAKSLRLYQDGQVFEGPRLTDR